MHGSIKRLLTVVMLVPAGYAVHRAQLLTGCVSWSAYLIAACNAAFLPSLFFGVDVTKFYSAHGWGNSALVGGLLGYWILAVGIVSLVRRPLPEPERTVAMPSWRMDRCATRTEKRYFSAFQRALKRGDVLAHECMFRVHIMSCARRYLQLR